MSLSASSVYYGRLYFLSMIIGWGGGTLGFLFLYFSEGGTSFVFRLVRVLRTILFFKYQ
jgi:hypothetical protein